jgi:hypothetical protein
MFVSVLRRAFRLSPAVIAIVPFAALASIPTQIAAPDLKPGDSWVFDRSTERGTSGFSNQRFNLKIEHVGADTMVVGIKLEGSPTDYEDHFLGSDWSQTRLIDGNRTTTGRPFVFPMEIGKTWTMDYVDPTRHNLQVSAEHHATYKVTGWEDVTTPAGAFHALKIEGDEKVKAQFMAANAALGGAVSTADGATVIAKTNNTGPHAEYVETFSTFDYVPEVKYWVKAVEDTYNSNNVRTNRRTDLLISFKPAS